VTALTHGQAPVYEPRLAELLASNLASGRLRYTTNLREALHDASFVLITYDTPVDENDEVDLSDLYKTARELGQYMRSGATVVVSSQVPVGTCEELREIIHQANPSCSFGMAYTPENLRLGQAVERFKHPEMLVIGADTPETFERVDQLLSVIQAPRVTADLRTAEMTKHAINAYLGMAISFGNELANLCDEVGADALKVIQALRLDSRVSPKAPLLPGLGFGGGTLARDLKVLQHVGEQKSYDAALITAVLKVNAQQNGMVVRRLKQFYRSLERLTVGVLGLTYKEGTSTLRRSASLEIIQAIGAEGASVKAYDPKADPHELEPYLRYFTLCDNPYIVAEGSHALVLVTAWPEFRELDFPRIRASMQNPVLLDAQNMLDADLMGQMGFLYQGIGRGRVPPEVGSRP
jgi:UDPglucose 6-dehydrogenase